MERRMDSNPPLGALVVDFSGCLEVHHPPPDPGAQGHPPPMPTIHEQGQAREGGLRAWIGATSGTANRGQPAPAHTSVALHAQGLPPLG